MCAFELKTIGNSGYCKIIKTFQSHESGEYSTIWSTCLFCDMKHVLKHLILIQKCEKFYSFTAVHLQQINDKSKKNCKR